jgi:hypothetical protein
MREKVGDVQKNRKEFRYLCTYDTVPPSTDKLRKNLNSSFVTSEQ